MYVYIMVQVYGVIVILYIDYCVKKFLFWIDGLVEVGEKFYKDCGYLFYSFYMFDFFEESLEENVEICVRYYECMSKIGMMFEIEFGVIGGEEDGVDNIDVDSFCFYIQFEEVVYVYEVFNKISECFIIVVVFGNVYGVYKLGNVELKFVIFKNLQEYVKEKFGIGDNFINFVFYGGFGFFCEEICEVIEYGVIKMNIDIDLQWAFWDGICNYDQKYYDYLQV